MTAIAPTGRFSFFPILDNRNDNQYYYGDQSRTDKNRPDIVCNPSKHTKFLSLCVNFLFYYFDFFAESCGFFIGTNQHIDHACKSQKRSDETDHIDISGKHLTELIDH